MNQKQLSFFSRNKLFFTTIFILCIFSTTITLFAQTFKYYFADVNGDGRKDLIQVDNGLGMRIGLADYYDEFALWSHSLPTGRYGGVYQHHFADVNGDGRADLIQTNNNLDMWVGLADYNGKFTLWSYSLPTGRYGGVYQHYFADVNGDGRADLIQTNKNLDIWVGLADYNGKFTLWSQSTAIIDTAELFNIISPM